MTELKNIKKLRNFKKELGVFLNINIEFNKAILWEKKINSNSHLDSPGRKKHKNNLKLTKFSQNKKRIQYQWFYTSQ